mmetsp:Transcript_11719/g.21323  ORF Transcript_11719/g.21323 Transcript_11719/m.21323 type:complete len:204 (-) Transcript_11719:1664-2275(-)
MHRCQFGGTGCRNVNIQTLTLANKGSSVSRHIQNHLLRNFPHSLVHITNLFRNFWYILDGSAIGNNTIPNRCCPQTTGRQLTQQVFVNNCEFSSKNTTIVHVGSERFRAFVVTQDLGRRRRGHGSKEKGVPHAVLGNLDLESCPIPHSAWCHSPHVKLQFTLAGRRALVRLVGTFHSSQFHTCGAGTKVNRLKNLNVQFTCLG